MPALQSSVPLVDALLLAGSLDFRVEYASPLLSESVEASSRDTIDGVLPPAKSEACSESSELGEAELCWKYWLREGWLRCSDKRLTLFDCLIGVGVPPVLFGRLRGRPRLPFMLHPTRYSR